MSHKTVTHSATAIYLCVCPVIRQNKVITLCHWFVDQHFTLVIWCSCTPDHDWKCISLALAEQKCVCISHTLQLSRLTVASKGFTRRNALQICVHSVPSHTNPEVLCVHHMFSGSAALRPTSSAPCDIAHSHMSTVYLLGIPAPCLFLSIWS